MKRVCFPLLLVLSLCVALPAQEKPVILDPSYRHDILETRPQEIMKYYRAYTVSFDSDDDDGGNGTQDRKAIPEWVAYELRKYPSRTVPSYDRPDWFTDKNLKEQGLAVDDDTYHFAADFRRYYKGNWMLGYDRGHLCAKQHASRLGADADWNTHTLLNCIPQRSILNQGAWLDLENKCAEWADHYGRVWIIAGPIIYGKEPNKWLGQVGEPLVAVPDAVFKIVYKATKNRKVDVLAFIYPQETPKQKGGYDHRPYLTSVRAIEHFTGLTFFNALPQKEVEELKAKVATDLWPVSNR